jgi:hypothetical protein
MVYRPYCPPLALITIIKKLPYMVNVRDVTVTRPLQYLLNVSGGLMAKISDNKIAIKGKRCLSDIFHISLSSTFIITPIIKWEKILKKTF